MSHVKADLVQETTTSSSTGALALTAVTRRRRFGDVCSNGDTCYVLIEHSSAAEYEVCLATWNTGHSLTRGAVVWGSSGTSAVDFSAGTKTVTLVAIASELVTMDPNGDATVTRDVYGRQFVFNTNGYGYALVDSGGTVRNAMFMGSDNHVNHMVAGGSGKKWRVLNQAQNAELFSVDNGGVGYISGILGIGGAAPDAGMSLYVAGSDGARIFGVVGTTKGIRVGTTASLAQIDGVDNTLITSYQPLFLNGGTNLILGADGSQIVAVTIGAMRPVGDNSFTLGHSSFRWSVVYAATGAINTSGREAKVGIRESTDAEREWARLIKERGCRAFQLKDAVDVKGEAARWHFGYVVEDILEDAKTAGIEDPWRYAFLCRDEIVRTETYTEKATRPVLRKVSTTEKAVEIRDGRPVLIERQVERDEPVGEMVPVVGDDLRPVMVASVDADGNEVLAPMLHFVPELEEYDVERTREVATGEYRLGLRYSELEAFLRCAG